jgi:uncharacterized protein
MTGALLVLAVAVSACAHDARNWSCPRRKPPCGSRSQDTQARRERGLMGVRAVPSGEGMLFAFADGDGQHQFWMKDTLVPLDMIFVRSDGMVMAIAEKVSATKAGTPDDRIARRNGEGRYVIELASGEAERAGLDVGMRLAIPEIAAR